MRGADREVQTGGCKPQTVQTLQTSIRVLTLARFCGAAPRSGRVAGRTRRPCGATSVLVGQRCDGAKTTSVAMRKQPANPHRNALQCGWFRHVASRYDALRFRAMHPFSQQAPSASVDGCLRVVASACGINYSDHGGVVAYVLQGFCDPAPSLATACVTLRDAAVSSAMRGGCPLSSTTINVSACRQRRHAVGRAQPSCLQITFHGT